MSDIATLFARDPEKMSKADIDALLRVAREKRHIFNSGPAPSATKLTKKEEEVTNKLDLKIDLGGL